MVEVLVALVIFAVSAVVLGASYLNVLNNYELIRQNQAMEEDVRFIRKLVLEETDREELEEGGDFESLYLGLVSWRTFLEETPTPDLFLVRIEIEYEGSDETPGGMEVQEFYALRPDWSDPVVRDQLRAESEERFRERREMLEGGRW